MDTGLLVLVFGTLGTCVLFSTAIAAFAVAAAQRKSS